MKTKAESNAFLPKYTLNIGGQLIDFATPCIMGILNVTPDSFFDGNLYRSEAAVVKRAGQIVEEGGLFIDVGGYSTRPGAEVVPLSEEIRRVTTAIRAIVKEFPKALISIDTFRAEVAKAAFAEGAALINDVSAGALDPEMMSTVVDLRAPYIMMHMKGDPGTMASLAQYENLLREVIASLQEKIHRMHSMGHFDLIVDPGFGFAKNITQNFFLLNHLEELRVLEKPVLVGLSRKSMIWKTLGIPPGEALNGTTALNAIALTKGASILRVHDVKEAAQTIKLIKSLKSNDN